ncbi:MAG: FecR family protein [Deltaproteobacteria bacterium]|nr:FecR family protein [Deltaproteobacteria bacterium]
MAAVLSDRRGRAAALLTALVLGLSTPAFGQGTAASFARVSGNVEVQRGANGEWQAAFIGAPVFVGETIRTDATGSALLVFNDDGVLALGNATTLTVERYPGTAKNQRNALFKLAQGAVEAMVTGYKAEDARFEIETPSAVARVQSTRFVVRFDPTTRATDVAGLDGVVAVQGRTGLIGPGVAVGPDEATRVESGKFPTEVKPFDAAQRSALFAGLVGIGTGERDGLAANNPVLEGRVVAPQDRPQVATAAEGGYLHPSIPDEPLIWRLSPDIRANTQPIPVYQAVPPNEVPPQP